MFGQVALNVVKTTWRGKIVNVTPVDWRTTAYNHSCDSIASFLPPLLSYHLVPKNAPLTDVIWSGTGLHLYSPDVVDFLSGWTAAYEVIPAKIYDAKDPIRSQEYRHVHLLGCVDALDWTRSDIDIKMYANGAKRPDIAVVVFAR
jgi:hypothetical protein